jgi:AcrR family transcriptional regulator
VVHTGVDHSERLSAADRREALLDIALELLVESGVSAITMGAVADRAEVTRALVYKHFDNADDLVIELQRREARRVDREIVAVVQATEGGFEPKLTAMVQSLVAAADKWESIFSPLGSSVAGRVGREEQRRRDRRALDYFASLAAGDYGLDLELAERALRICFGGIDVVMTSARRTTDPAERASLAELYVALVVGGLAAQR